MDRLVELSLSELIILRDRYKFDGLNSEQLTYNNLRNFVSWLQQDATVSGFHGYSLNGDLSDGTFVAIHLSYIYADTLNENKTRLVTALCSLNLDSKKNYRCLFKESTRSAIWDFIERKRINTGPVEWKFYWYYMTPEEGSQIHIPELAEGLQIKPLSETDVLIANNHWPFHYPESEIRLKNLQKYNLNIGVYTNFGELVAWCLRYEYGGLGLLQVKESHQRRGLAKYVARVLTKKVAELGESPFCTIADSNDISIRVFKSIGYMKDGVTYYIEILPAVVNSTNLN